MPDLQPMQIAGFSDENFQSSVGEPYKVLINPESVKLQRSIDYNEQQPPDSSTASQKYKHTASDKLSFDIVIDCTGIVDSTRTNMATEISTLENIVFIYQGKIHRPNYVQIIWGKNTMFQGVLNTMDISYTLFRPDGSPLRAKVSMTFSQYLSPALASKKQGDESPDLTHLVTVTDGLSLPQMCQQIWNNENYYVQVAKFNGLNKFRNLKGISTMAFPPIIPQQHVAAN
jgi:hypothetical protein